MSNAQIIKVGSLKSSWIFISLSPSGTGGTMGTLIKANKLKSGIIAQSIGMYIQFSVPINLIENVVISTTEACPQQ